MQEKIMAVLKYLQKIKNDEKNGLTAAGIRIRVFNNEITPKEADEIFNAIVDKNCANYQGGRSIIWNYRTDECLKEGYFDKPIAVTTQNITHGDNSPISGRDTTIGDIESKNAKVNKENQSLDLQPELKPIEKPATKSKINAATIIQKIGGWIISNLWQFILLVAAAIVATYLIFKFGIPH